MTEAWEAATSGTGATHDCQGEPSPALLLGIEQFNQGLFFEQHETLEDAWMEESGRVRYLYQGILQVGVGFYHLQRGNYRGAAALLRRGIGYLGQFAPACLDVDVARLLQEAGQALAELERLGPNGMSDFDPALVPHVHLIQLQEKSDG